MTGRIPIPAELTGGRVVYSYDGYIEREYLPKGWLSLPYIHCQAVPGEKGNVYQIAYPNSDGSKTQNAETRAIPHRENA